MRSRIGALAPTLVAYHAPLSPAAETFRGVRTNLQFLGLDHPLKSVVITSATPSEGKSTSAANLAVAFTQAGAEVCLVDADLRRPSLHTLFGLPNWTGLTNVLAGSEPDPLPFHQPGIPGLSILTSGPIPPNPSEMLGSRRMQVLLSRLEQQFDMVIIDTPPVLAVTDALVLSPKVGGVLLVARSGGVTQQQAGRAKVMLEGVKASMLGAIMTAVQADTQEYAYTYYYTQEEPAGRAGFWERLWRLFGGRRRQKPAFRGESLELGGNDRWM